jgi:arylsulfatase A
VWTDEAVQFIERHQREPFFLHVTYNAPHTPLEAPEEDQKLFKDSGKFNLGVSMIYAMIHRMDTGVAHILDTLKRLGLEENTIVIFTSDNGPQFGGEGDHNTTRFNSQFNGAKGSVYEGGIRVPLIIRWPAGLEGGRQVSEMVHFSDWFPTLLAAAGISPGAKLPLDGVNVMPVLHGETGPGSPARFWQWNRYQPLVTCNAAVRDGDWKLVRPVQKEAMQVADIHWLWVSMYGPEYFLQNGIFRNQEPVRGVPEPVQPELYNIASDPLEQDNLAEQHPDAARALLLKLENWFDDVEREFRAAYAQR